MKRGALSVVLLCAFGCSGGTRPGVVIDLGMTTVDFAGIQGPTNIDSPVDIRVVFTADNSYAFGWGDETQVNTLMGRPGTTDACGIFCCPVGNGPEEYAVPAAEAPASAYLYIIAWADQATTQGVLGQFERGAAPLYTGDPAFEVCATGLSYPTGTAPGGGPTVAVVNAEITRCTNGSGSPSTTSAGWVSSTGAVTAGAGGKLAIGEDNSAAGGDFPITCQVDSTGKHGIDAEAKWMWYQPTGVTTPFTSRGTRDFLIFRLKSADVPIQ